MNQILFNDGDIILTEGAPSDFVYRILSGEVEIFSRQRGETIVLGTANSGEFLGEMGIIERLSERLRHANIKTRKTGRRLLRASSRKMRPTDCGAVAVNPLGIVVPGLFDSTPPGKGCVKPRP